MNWKKTLTAGVGAEEGLGVQQIQAVEAPSLAGGRGAGGLAWGAATTRQHQGTRLSLATRLRF